MEIGNGNGNGDGNEFRDSLQAAVAKAQATTLAEDVGKLLGGFTGFAFTTFFVPFVIVYAYNGLQPAVWPDISYLPAVAGWFAFRTLVNMLRKE